MKKITSLLLLALMCAMSASAQAVIGGTTYKVDTLEHRAIGPGVVHTKVRLADYPLNAYVLEMDMTNPYNRVETTQANNLLGKQEYLETAYKRHKSYGKKPLAACNSAFWCVSGTGEPYTLFMMGHPFGGEVVNDTIYENTNTNVDGWNGGPKRTGSTIIDKNKKVSVGRHQWYGYVKSSKFSADQEIIQVNKRCDTGQLTLFNHALGRNQVFYTVADCDYVYLNFKADSKWGIATDMKFEVAEIVTGGNSRTLGNYDACLVCDGDYKTEFAKLSAGDEVTINTYWVNLDGDSTPIAVENMTEGNAYVMLNGELTKRNTNETYNSQIYSRTAYGTNAEGNKLYMIVIDKSTHPEYGKSAGCSTTVMCELWKFLCPDLWNAANYDAGGSAQMLVEGSVVNKTTENSPRAVANGMMMFSIAPEEDADVIASLAFGKAHLRTSPYMTFAPTVLGYNKYGELIDTDVQGLAWTCSDNVGAPKADGSAIEVGATPALGTVTATLGSISVTAAVEVQNVPFAIRLNPILIDNKREYAMEVTATIDGEAVKYDPSRFEWSVSDETVAVIEEGVLKGLKNGSVTVKCTLGDFSDETVVNVEIAPQPRLYQEWTDWTLVASRVTNAVLGEDGVLSFTYSGAMRASITMSKDITFYSIPDKLWLELTTTTPMTYITADLRSNLSADSENKVDYKGDDGSGYVANTTYKVELQLPVADADDLGEYPLHFKSLMFVPSTSGCNKGENSMTLSLYAQYGDDTSGVENLLTGEKAETAIKVFAGGDGSFTVSAPGKETVAVTVCNPAGAAVYAGNVTVNGGCALVDAGLQPGLYIVQAVAAGERAVCKIIVK